MVRPQVVTIALTWVNLLVAGYSISIHNNLKPFGELVSLVVSGWVVCGPHAVENGGHCRSTALLMAHEREGGEREHKIDEGRFTFKTSSQQGTAESRNSDIL